MRLACEECHHVTDEACGWIAKVIEDDDEFEIDPFLVFYCPTCAEREFSFVFHRRPDDEFE